MTDLAPGTEFGGCRIDGVAGRGGMGVVYSATELRLDRKVAVKLIAANHAADREFRERFERESRLAASIDHPNVVPIYGAGEQDGCPYLVMRLVRGTDLHKLLAEHGHLPVDRVALIISQVAAALDAAHAAGLVHRDVKPANVLIDDEHVYLTDFGLTRLASSDTQLTETGRWMGTVDFASPEQLTAKRTDARSDVYALGCVLYAALCGEPPYARATVPAAIVAHLNDPIPVPSERGAPRAFDRVIRRVLAKDPADRYPSAGDLGRAVVAAASGERVTEDERTVATGPAAPHPEARTVILPDNATATVATATVARSATKSTKIVKVGEYEYPAEKRARKRRRRRTFFGVTLFVVVGLGTVGALAIAGAGGADPLPAVQPVTDDEIRTVVGDFAAAYSREDPKALGRLLTEDVTRVLPGDAGVQHGRADVVAQYAQQFHDMAIDAYEVSDVEVDSGVAGRAEGRYTVHRKKASSFGGSVVLGVVKEYGKLKIRLIAARPA